MVVLTSLVCNLHWPIVAYTCLKWYAVCAQLSARHPALLWSAGSDSAHRVDSSHISQHLHTFCILVPPLLDVLALVLLLPCSETSDITLL